MAVHTPWFVPPAAAAAAVVSTAIVPTAAVILAKTEASRDSKDSP